MRRIVSILILSLFVYNTIGFLAVHPLISMYYKYLGMQQADKASEEDLIELLVFSKEDILQGKIDFRWIHSREFKYNGDMYDIVKKGEDDKQLFLHCINDTKEMEMKEEFEKRVHKNSLEDKQRPITNNFNLVSLSEPVLSEQTANALVCESAFNYWWTDSYKSLRSDIPSPPPRFV